MIPKQEMFRKAALDRLSSPEQLDVLMQVTQPRAWIALTVMGALLLLALLWGIFGVLPSRVQAQGILINPGGIFDVFATSSGPISELRVAEGDLLEEGQVVAVIRQADLERQLEGAQAKLAELRQQDAQLRSFMEQDKGLRDDSVLLKRAALQDAVKYAGERLKALSEQIASEEQLLEQGLITRQSLLQTKQSYFATKDQLERARSDLQLLSVSQLSDRSQTEQQRTRSRMSIAEAERDVQRLQELIATLSEVRSPYGGRVVELRAKRGDLVRQGSTVLSLQLAGAESAGLQALIYVPPNDGKNVRPGMEARISPSSAKKEEYGFLVGKVTYVSEFPSTRDGMMRVLSNDGLVQTMSKDGPPFAVYAELLPDAESVSGYRWSSRQGRSLKVAAGTLCEATVTVRRRRPISMVIPLLRESMGL